MQNQKTVYFSKLLEKVSRTFALNIRCLKGDMYHTVMCGYLFMRIIDTIEDSTTLTPLNKKRRLGEFSAFLRASAANRQPDNTKTWVKKCAEISENAAENELILKTPELFKYFNKLPAKLRLTFYQPACVMAQGMAGFIVKFETTSGETIKQLETIHELLDYCYVVAGTVGEFLTELFALSLNDKIKKQLRKNAVHFGHGLQLVNILKDYADDIKRGWVYLPLEVLKREGINVQDFFKENLKPRRLKAMNTLYELTSRKLKKALNYSLSIPPTQRSFRLFCLIPLLLAKSTLSLLKDQENFQEQQKKRKISKHQVFIILLFSKCFWFSDKLIKYMFHKL